MTAVPAGQIPRTSSRVSVHEIAELTARLRRITEAGQDSDPVEREAYLAAKRELIERIEVNQ